MSTRIITADATDWLHHHAPEGAIVTSLPDWDEVYTAYPTIDTYLQQFDAWATLCIAHASEHHHPAVFFQTDRLYAGSWIDKAAIIHSAAVHMEVAVAWHKIVLRRDPGKTDLYRPTYSHLIAISNRGPGTRTPDVIPPSGSLYPKGTPTAAAMAACVYATGYAQRIIDPFCGYGTILKAADTLGVDSVGVDIDPIMVERASQLTYQASLFA